MGVSPPDPKARPMDRLVAIMAQLRNRESGCPWDIEQTFATIAPHTIEEAYEVADAIERGAMGELRDELGDLLFQSVYHARMAEEEGHFTFDDVATAIAEKLIRRHPHVFGETSVENTDAQTAAWETQKAEERRRKAEAEGRVASVLDGVTPTLPALTRSEKIGKRVARVGFDWPNVEQVIDKLNEELDELRVEVEANDQEKIAEEMGDLLFVVTQLARKLKVDPETALRRANLKFERRFHHVEARLAEDGRAPDQSTLEEMEELWAEAKRLERESVS
ncbi:nucleoside triphosphate pyrophosphohydrolase [Rhodospirillum sp. A1_3_36]|uniref:nucleoside triphosphate pyrophosphohydrolase n=1 Tax=Rhodospirillum sp. A1_3_36 TaxID=3391666 RepID=UPI0039A4C0EA